MSRVADPDLSLLTDSERRVLAAYHRLRGDGSAPPRPRDLARLIARQVRCENTAATTALGRLRACGLIDGERVNLDPIPDPDPAEVAAIQARVAAVRDRKAAPPPPDWTVPYVRTPRFPAQGDRA